MITLRRKTHKEQVVELLVRIANLQGEILKLKGENAELSRENRLLGERCNQLLKDKGELTDQIEKMKCCYNCSKWYDGECEESPKSKTFFCADFKCDKWECIE